MPYKNKADKAQYDIEYAKKNLKQVMLTVRKDYYANVLKPAAERACKPVNTFIKEAIQEKIDRESKQS